MPFVIQLEPDTASAAAILSAWNRVCERLQAGGAYPEITPHISLAACSLLDIGSAVSQMRHTLESTPLVRVVFESAGAFLTSEGAVFMAPVPTMQLLALQSCVTDVLRAANGEPGGFYASGKWMPHCSLAFGLSAPEAGALLGACCELLGPLEAVFDFVSLVEYGSGPAVWHERVRLMG